MGERDGFRRLGRTEDYAHGYEEHSARMVEGKWKNL
jgi:hypothetical protein